MPAPLLSVIIPTRNRHSLLVEAVRSCLAPLPFETEILVSDNASIDSTATIKEAFPKIDYRRRTTLLPMAEHWNLAVSEARGKYVKVLCDDDWLLPGALAREVAALEKDESLTAVASAKNEVSADGKNILRQGGPTQDIRLNGINLFQKMLVAENVLGPPSAVTFRKSAFRGFPANYDYAADWAAWIKLADQGPVLLLAEPGCAFRLHVSNLTDQHVEAGTDFVEVMALRRECLARLPGLRFRVQYYGIFIYRLWRRIARRLVRRQELGNFLARMMNEERKRI